MNMSDAETAYKAAEAEIERVRTNGRNLLSLSGEDYKALNGLPDSITQLTTLTELHLNTNQVIDLTPIAQLTALTALYISDTLVSDLTPIAKLTTLTTLYLHNTPVIDLTPIAQLTALTALGLNNTWVSDLRPLTALRKLAEDPQFQGLEFNGTTATNFDLSFAEIAKIKDAKNRAAELFAYLEDWEPPVVFDENGPTPSPLLDVTTIGDKLEIADSHPSEAERDDQLKPLHILV
jgi:Leucine-rich repeat (LRR) protein